MKIEGSHIIKASRSRVFALLITPDVLARCVPGCESLEANEDGSYKMTLKAGVGSIKGLFNGTIRLEEIREPEHYKMIVDGKGSIGFVKGVGEMDLAEQGEETVVNYAGDVNVGGTIAGVGQRMILSSAKMMANQFFTSIGAEAGAIAEAEASGEAYEPPKHGFIRNTIRQIKK
ncbi:MAG: SRPBCC family protein [Blastocatellia bacterium]